MPACFRDPACVSLTASPGIMSSRAEETAAAAAAARRMKGLPPTEEELAREQAEAEAQEIARQQAEERAKADQKAAKAKGM